MKIKPDHYKHMRQAIIELVETKRDAVKQHVYTVHNDPRVNDFDKRLRWDLFNAARLSTYACDTLYSYLDDSHIDTALRAIMKEINLTEDQE